MNFELYHSSKPQGERRYEILQEKVAALRLQPLQYDLTAIPEQIRSELEAAEISRELYPVTISALVDKMKAGFVIKMQTTIEENLKQIIEEKPATELLSKELQEALKECHNRIERNLHPVIARREAARIIAKQIADAAFSKLSIAPIPTNLNGKSAKDFIVKDLHHFLSPITYPNLNWKEASKTITEQPVHFLNLDEAMTTSWEQLFQDKERYHSRQQFFSKSATERAEILLTQLQVIHRIT